jgi:hypothetical protein
MARLLALTATLNPPGTSRSRRRTVTTAWTGEQSHLTSSAPLTLAISAARDSARSSATTPTPPPSASQGVSAANAAMSAAVCAAALAPANAPTSIPTTPTIRSTPTSANPTRVAPPPSPAVASSRSPMVASGRSPRVGPARSPPTARIAGGLIGRRGSVKVRARGRRPRSP